MGETIDVRELRVGMYVHLDVGWMSHPFPLSSFKIASAEQIETIRGLGLQRVRWYPDKSDLPAAPVPALRPADAPAAPAAGGAPADPAADARRAALAAQRAAQELAERQYGEAAAAWDAIAANVAEHPMRARGQAEALAQALLDKLATDQQVCIRLLTEGAGERATAHALNVTIVSLLLGRAFHLPAEEMLALGVGAMLHDVGKLELPPQFRFADGGFSSSVDLAVYREHVALGVEQGRRMALDAGVLTIIAQHHEQADGSGFPAGLTLERLSDAARIVAMVNRYDNLCNAGHPSRGVTPHEALSMLFTQGQHKFDATMLSSFVRMMGVYPPGSLVQLTDDRYAMVVAVDSARPLKPTVLLYDAQVPREDALHLDLQTCRDLGIRRSLKPAQLPAAALAYLSPGQRVAYFFEPSSPPVPQHLPVDETGAQALSGRGGSTHLLAPPRGGRRGPALGAR
jgi:putative nucleotidyltransferase with HDIG domain